MSAQATTDLNREQEHETMSKKLVNGVYAAAFGSHCPARSTVQVARLPRDVLVEIEAVVLLS